jgi:hypothetical protein
MAQRSLVTLLAAVGGVLVILGGFVGFLLRYGAYSYGPRYGMVDIAVVAALAIIFGLVILFFSGYTQLHSVEQNLTGGVVLIILGLVTWVVAGAWILVAVGAFLTIVAGLVLVVLVIVHEPQIRVQIA